MRERNFAAIFAFPVLMWQAKYETIYLLGTSIARPLISKICLDVAKEVGAKAYATARRAREMTSAVFSWQRKRLIPPSK